MLRGVREEIVDVAFSIGAKAHNRFLVVCRAISQREASHRGRRALAWLAIARTGAWKRRRAGGALPRVDQFLIQ